MNNKIQHKIAALSSLILGLTFGLPNQPAQAYAYKCSFFGLDGETCIQVISDGLKVNSFQGSFKIGRFQSGICNWYYTIKLYDTANKKYTSATGPIHSSSCDKSGVFTQSYNTKPFPAKEGRVCAELHEIKNGKDYYIDAACANLTP